MINVQTPIMCRRRTNKEGGSKPQTTLFNGPLSTKSCHCFHEKCLCLALVFILNVVILKLPLKNDCNNRTALFYQHTRKIFSGIQLTLFEKEEMRGKRTYLY